VVRSKDVETLGRRAEHARVVVEYSQGWPIDRSLRQALEHGLDRDLSRGTTTQGPHRFDLRFLYDGVPIKEYFSRGQKKHLVAQLKLLQVRLFIECSDARNVLFLGDDVFSELDYEHASELFEALRTLGVQTFATTLETPEKQGFFNPEHDRMFHVEHGILADFPPSGPLESSSE
jgi:DNA replication and repair protein RecF